MRTAGFIRRVVAKRVAPFFGNRHKSIYDPRHIDELVHALNLLLDMRVVVKSSGVSELVLSDSRANLILAIPPAVPDFLSTWHVKVHHDEYLECVSWNGAVEGANLVKIAKPNTLRSSLISELLPDGTTMAYSTFDLSGQTRQADGDDGTSEVQAITPRYMVVPDDLSVNSSHVVYAASAKTLAKDEDGKTIALMDMNPQGRAYAKV